MKPKDVLGLAKDRGAVMVDIKFMDFVGLWQHFTVPLGELTEEIFEEGLGFDGSSIRGWKRSKPPTCWPCPTRPRRSSIRSARCRP